MGGHKSRAAADRFENFLTIFVEKFSLIIAPKELLSIVIPTLPIIIHSASA